MIYTYSVRLWVDGRFEGDDSRGFDCDAGRLADRRRQQLVEPVVKAAEDGGFEMRLLLVRFMLRRLAQVRRHTSSAKLMRYPASGSRNN